MVNKIRLLWFRQLPIQKKISLVVLFACAIVLTLSAVANLFKDISMVRQAMVDKHKVLATVIADNLVPGLLFHDPESINKTIASLRQEPSIHYVQIFLPDGSPYLHQVTEHIDGRHEKRMHAEIESSTARLDQCPFEVFDREHLHICRKIAFHGEVLGSLLIVAYSGEISDTLLSDLVILAVVLFFSLSVAYLLARPVSQILAEPLVQLTSLMRNVTEAKDYSLRSTATGSDEIGMLAQDLNNMLREIQKRDEQLRFYNLELERNVASRTIELEEVVKQLQEAKEKAEKASQAKSSFLSSMSHELRTPLSSVIGYSQLFQADPSLGEDHKRGALAIFRAGKHLLSLIEDILDLSRIESGTLSISNDTVAVNDLLQEVEPLVQNLVEKFSVQLHVQLDSCREQYIIADYTRLKQVMVNLVSNAIKYNKPGGDVWVSCEQPTENTLRLLVKDTGKGLSLEQVQHLFEPFNRLDADKGKIEGTGIGLVITRRLMDLMNGVVGVESTKGEGSTFWIELQRAELIMSETSEVMEIDHKLTEDELQSVLYIEDNPETARLVQSIFEKQYPWVSLHIEGSGEAGMEYLQSNKPDVVLLDINLPGMSGYEVLQRIRVDDQISDVVVIGFSANAMSEDIKRALAIGFDAYLTKPVDTNDLQRTLYLALSQKGARD